LYIDREKLKMSHNKRYGYLIILRYENRLLSSNASESHQT